MPCRDCYSARAAARFLLKLALEERLRSELKWLKTEAWTAANIFRLRIRLAVALQRFSEEVQGSLLVQRLCHEALENLAFVIERPPR